MSNSETGQVHWQPSHGLPPGHDEKPWWIDPVDPQDGGRRFYVVATETGSDTVRLTVSAERQARELRDLLNKIKPAVSAWAL